MLESALNGQGTENMAHIWVVNNGHPTSCDFISEENANVTVLQTGGENLGWEGGLKFALADERVKAPFVMFLNDDTHIPMSSKLWLNNLIQFFKYPTVGAVGPTSNIVMGKQNIFLNNPLPYFPVSFLIGFCVLFKRSILDEIGGVDDTLPGGDDLDYSIRLKDHGYKLVVAREVFVYHHGFKTGTRVKGNHDKPGGWNSIEMTETTNFALIKKHGFRKWYDCLYGGLYSQPQKDIEAETVDVEGNEIREIIGKPDGKLILDVGCGGNKTLPEAIGIDMIETGGFIESLTGAPASQADLEADVSKPLPFAKNTTDFIIARHILEHMLDPLDAIPLWANSLKKDGKLIIAVPDQDLISSIPMNIEHVHAWSKSSMKRILELLGFDIVQQFNSKNNISFITVAQKHG